VETLALVSACGAALAAVIYIGKQLVVFWRRVRRIYRLLDTGMDIIQRELGEDHDGSMKDDLTHMAIAIGLLQRHQSHLHRQILRVARLGAKHHPSDVWEYGKDDHDPL